MKLRLAMHAADAGLAEIAAAQSARLVLGDGAGMIGLPSQPHGSLDHARFRAVS
jgi:hypothetical protein